MKMLLLFSLLLFSSQLSSSKATLTDYIIDVHPPMSVKLTNQKDIQAYYYSFLPKIVAHTGETRMIHTYFHAMSGFAARLTENEVNEMAKKKGFLRARPSRVFNLLTTHTPDFLGLQTGFGLWKSSEMGTIIGKSEPLTVAAFSSRGPNSLHPGILKPDILGPGVNILSAWLGLDGSPSDVPTNEGFNIMSGTSMSTPHLIGIAALVKQIHPDWTPAAIKSAIMTTSMAEDHDGKPIKNEQLHPADFFVMGVGHVNPSKVVDPGLVFDIDKKDYIGFLYSLDYTDEQVYIITGDNVQCSKIHNISQSELNCPAIVFSRKQCVTVNRTVTNVGEAMSTYKVEIDMPDEAMVKVVPTVLEFNKLNEKKSYMVSIVKSNDVSKKHVHGNLRWVSHKYIVRTPIVIVDHY
ncbi:hypothetical protein J5N97_021692 [Dioscorea zingiberensis]|uniref:Uncharacterized protein n=1 Tax=Dioscorea zingiberensis TaxID=325984 RepID=A0A9D5CAG9_9LILI|nr:hypothetical protein J5N97_021692 [Dioscorea zingiberensis]